MGVAEMGQPASDYQSADKYTGHWASNQYDYQDAIFLVALKSAVLQMQHDFLSSKPVLNRPFQVVSVFWKWESYIQ